MNQDSIRVTLVKPFQWRDLKTVRLEALQREPAAYSATYDDTVLWPDEFWRQRVDNPDNFHLIARLGQQPIGMGGAFLGANDGRQEVAIVFGVYVNQEYRRRGVARQLMRELLDLIVVRYPEVRTVRLWVTDAQPGAVQLYESLGFQIAAQTADTSLSPGETLPELMMERPVRLDLHAASDREE